MIRIRLAVVVAVMLCAVPGLTIAGASAAPLDIGKYLDIALPNRDAAHGPGGANNTLPTSSKDLKEIIDAATAQGIPSARYRAVLYEYWLARSTEAAGINLATWNPRDGVTANKDNLVKSYRYYENLQLGHRELQWAGMAGMVGADFGGGMLDLQLGTDVYAGLPGLQQATHAIVTQALNAGGRALADQLPTGLRALATVGARITPADIREVSARILIMQKNIFGDLMPLHTAYVTEGINAVHELVDTGLYPADIGAAFDNVASGDPSRIAAGNSRLLRREQFDVVAAQWDATRHYKGDVGEALTYASTAVGSPSVAGVIPLRQYHPITVSAKVGGRLVTLTAPLPKWNWSVFGSRWSYITSQLLPKYAHLVTSDWPTLRRQLLVPYETQLQTHRITSQIPQFAASLITATKVTVA